MADAKIIAFPGCTVPEVVVEETDFETVRNAVEQEVENAVFSLGRAESEVEWLVEVNALVERLLQAALRKSPDG